ncbi:MFS transporter [Companilactobacillus nodensis]|uniref:Major facilitator superfamily transporter permease n=1 Tax=Companilactobacillus nodensis DSM 19682 = JCM 14932 = NBRC 107160 TaxID=1423775 RepID=A0A0R1KF76_9LACO|nr:MFS transporter [Companilactobacillus nodensis]KRK78554.1 major facilitator superfamily transporter permease [Companilactobacillus nodensis DSM 19682 = JCM 14932 = NBRC 107160]
MKDEQVNSTWILVLTSLGFFMSMMDSMIVTTASTAIRTDLNISVNALQWAMNSYNITIAAVLLVGVSLGERIGRRKVYNWGIFIFTLGSIFCALSNNITILVVAHIIEGIGLSMAGPALQKAVLGSVDKSAIGKASGIYNVFRLLGGAVGATISVVIFYKFGGVSNAELFTNGFRAAMFGAGMISVLGVIFSLQFKNNLINI